RDGLRLQLHLRLEALPRGLVEQALGGAEGLRRPLRQLARERVDGTLELGVRHHARDEAPVERLARGEHAVGEIELHRAPQPDQARQEVRRRDRKSTRLNSSHGSISYAVFCLKKKKKTNTKRTCKIITQKQD